MSSRINDNFNAEMTTDKSYLMEQRYRPNNMDNIKRHDFKGFVTL